MPVKEKDGTIQKFPMSRDGVNLHKNILELTPTEAFQTQNCLWVNGMVKRGGQTLLTATEVVAGNKITGLHKFYKGDGTSQLLAACETKVKKYTAPNTWTDIGITQTTSLQTYFSTWGALNKAYICNGTDKMVAWDGTTPTQITIADGIPTQALPYQDRLLTIIGGAVTWSPSFSDTTSGGVWGAIADIGVKPDTKLYGMCYHSVANTSSGAQTMVLLAGSNGMYLLSATDLRWPSTTGDYQIQQLAIPVGCSAPRTMVWTPYGTVWLGIDRQVYGLPFGSVTPIPLGTKINSTVNTGLLSIPGTESIPTTQIANASACYSGDYYILSVAEQGSSVNNTQWWLDVRRLTQDDTGNFGPWFGPMKGQTISCFFSQTGTGDGGELIAGEATTKGYVYQLNQQGAYGDIDPSTGSVKSVDVVWQSSFNPLSDPLRSDVHKLEAQLMSTTAQINVNFMDIDQMLRTGDFLKINYFSTFWGVDYWGNFTWAGTSPVRSIVDISPAMQPRRLSVIFMQSTAVDRFELYSCVVEALEQNQVFV